jgi:MOSC domain-containing protein
MPWVRTLRIAPVKGLGLIELETIALEAGGVAENRRFFLRGAEGRHLSGLGHGPLVSILPDYDPLREWLKLRFPDGAVVEGSALAEGEVIELSFLDRRLAGRVVGGPFAGALSQFVGRPLDLVRASSTAEASEAAVSLISEASIEEIERGADHPGPLDDRRFRMLVTIDGVRPYGEEAWIGRDVRVGRALVRITQACARCATTTRDPSTGLRDFDALGAIHDIRGLSDRRTIDLGVYGRVVSPGSVAVGDEVVPAG